MCCGRNRGDLGEFFVSEKNVLAALFRLIWSVPSTAAGEHVTGIPDIFPNKLHKSLKEKLELGIKIFIPFPKPLQGIERCQRWVNACSREDFTINEITRNTYICALHWPGQRGPTDEFTDPLKQKFFSPGSVESGNNV